MYNEPVIIVNYTMARVNTQFRLAGEDVGGCGFFFDNMHGYDVIVLSPV